jgi:hypothetical protein
MYVSFWRLSALWCLLLLGACASLGDHEACETDSLVGSWKADWILEVWTFEADGDFICTGLCNFGPEIGQPVSWAGDSTANLWAQDEDYIKLEFTDKTFEGTIGGFRCLISDDGQELILEPIAGPDLTFTRVEFDAADPDITISP